MWDWFVDLDAARGGSGFGLNPIGYAEIEAYARLNGLRIRGWEARALRRMDGARLAKVAGGGSGEVGKIATRPMSPKLFDGLFGGATRAGRP